MTSKFYCSAWLAAVLAGGTAAADLAADRARLDQLVADGQFDLAEVFCQERLSDSQLAAAPRAAYTVEWMRILAARARQSPREQRARYWQQARAVAARYLRQYPKCPRRVLIELQDALTAADHGLVLQSRLAGSGDSGLPQAQAALREAIRLLRDVGSDVDRRLRWGQRQPDADEKGDLSRRELRGIRAQVGYELARVYEGQAQLFAAGSADRISAAGAALDELERLSPADLPPELWWQSRLNQVVGLRLKGDLRGAEAALQKLAHVALPEVVEQRLPAESIRLRLATGGVSAAQALLGQLADAPQLANDEVALAVLELLLASEQAAVQRGELKAVGDWQQKISEHLQRIERTRSRDTALRAAALVAASRPAVNADRSAMELSRHTAAHFYREGKLAEAISEFQRAASVADQKGAAREALEMLALAGSIEYQRGRQAPAQELFQRAAVNHPQEAAAPDTHLKAVKIAAQRCRDDPQQIGIYETLLREHLQEWPQGPVAEQVRRWLASLMQSRREFEAAAALWLEIEEDPDAIDRAADCLDAAWSQQPLAETRQAKKVSDTLRRFQPLETPDSAANGMPQSARQRAALLAYARLCARHFPDNLTSLVRALQPHLEPGAAPDAWRQSARIWHSGLLAAGGSWRAATHALDAINSGRAADWLELVQLLDRHDPWPHHQADAATYGLAVIKRAEAQVPDWTADQRSLMDRRRAASLLALGRGKEAARVYAQLVKRQPADGDLQEAYAQALLESRDTENVALALAQWREVLSKSRPRSPRWLRAKLGLAETHLVQDNPARAVEILRLVQTLYPDLDDAQLGRRLDGLLQRAQSQSQTHGKTSNGE